jgi:hypothetical protein
MFQANNHIFQSAIGRDYKVIQNTVHFVVSIYLRAHVDVGEEDEVVDTGVRHPSLEGDLALNGTAIGYFDFLVGQSTRAAKEKRN